MGLLNNADKIAAAEADTSWRATPADRADPRGIEPELPIIQPHDAAGCSACSEFDESGTELRASSVAGWCFVAIVAVVVALVVVLLAVA